MAKGDSIEVMIAGGTGDMPIVRTLQASKAGRRVERKTSTGRTKWVDVTEVTRNGRPTGNKLSVRLEAVLSIREYITEEG